MGGDGARENEGGAGRGGAANIAAMVAPAREIAGLDQKKLWRVFGVLLLLVGLALISGSIAEGSATKSVGLQILGAGSGFVVCAVGAVIIAATGRPVRPPAPPPLSTAAGAPRIGRYCRLVLDGYASAGVDGRLWVVTAHPGHGKSTLLELIGRSFKKRDATVVSLEAFGGEEGSSTFRVCEQIVEGIADNLIKADSAYASLADALLDAFKQYDMGESEADFDRLGRDVVNALSGIRGQLVLLVDELDAVTDEDARRWIFTLADRLAHHEQRLVVLASRPGPDLARLGTQLPLRKHGREEIEEEIRLRVPNPPAGCADRILEYSSGVPFAVDTALRHFAAGLSAEALGGGSGNDVRAIDSAVRKTLAQLDEGAAAICGERAQAPRLADWLAVLDQFDGDPGQAETDDEESGDSFGEVILSRLLVEHEGISPETADRLIAWLIRQDHLVRPVPGYQTPRYQLLTFLRETHLAGIRVNDPARFEFLHAKAEREYWRVISAAEAEDLPKARLRKMQVRYEGSEWHRVTLQWLNHAAAASPNPQASVEVARSCAVLLFKRYFWYDVMAPTVQCKELAGYYQQRWPDARWVAALARFHANYVSGPYSPGWLRQTAHLEAWRNTDAAIATLVRELGLPSTAAQVTDGTHEAFIYINLLRVDALRFMHRADAALELWEQVRQAGPESWILPWIDTFEAETLLELERAEEASSLLDGIEEKALSSNDLDLRIASGVTRSDVLWEQMDPSISLSILTRSLLAASAYHLQQEVVEEGEFSLPNMYSKLRHQHVAARLNGRLAEVERFHGKTARREWDTRIALFFEPYWDHWTEFYGRRSHSGSPLPPSPSMAELMDPDTNYYRCVQEGILHGMRKQLAQPLDTPLPSAWPSDQS